MFRSRSSELAGEITSVVTAGNCLGCGACATAFDGVDMNLDKEGFLRPVVSQSARGAARRFQDLCPGIRCRPQLKGPRQHEVFGSYVSAWVGWATDDFIRRMGSSGGVLTALSSFAAVESGVGVWGAYGGVAGSTQVGRLSPNGDLVKMAGSRYAPAASAHLDSEFRSGDVFVGKPCDVSGFRRLHGSESGVSVEDSLTMSFFCAGTPSLKATDELVTFLGMPSSSVESVRYRGDGWPGQFVASDGCQSVETDYDTAWGKFLGPRTQWRCRLCPEGTGDSADVVAGDFWSSDARGYPSFEESDGQSVIIARSNAGDALIRHAVAAGILRAEPVDLDDVAAVQPLQVLRAQTLAGRLIGVRLSGRAVPRIVGYQTIRWALRRPVANLKAALGSWRRSRRLFRAEKRLRFLERP